MIKFLYILLISSFLGYFTFQLSNSSEIVDSQPTTVQLADVDTALVAIEKLPEKTDFEEVDEEEIYYQSGDASRMALYAILQFISDLYE